MSELKVMIFLDQSNLHHQGMAANRKIDYVALMRYLANPEEGRRLVDCFIYAPLPHENGDRQARWHDYLRHSGLNVISKRAKRLPDGRLKANMDMEMGMDALECGLNIRPDVIVLGTGDGDMASLAYRLRRLGIRVEVASDTQALANELRAASHGVILLDDFLSKMERNGDAGAEAIGTTDILQPII
ncbi:MAG: NYN domain-containing protein [Geobacteraceae bacterium]|nr:NYN domain-containing protein [Geobacteraceae bacterium]